LGEGMELHGRGDRPVAIDLLREACTLLREVTGGQDARHGDVLELESVLSVLGMWLNSAGDFQGVAEVIGEASALHQQFGTGPPGLAPDIMMVRALAHADAGDALSGKPSGTSPSCPGSGKGSWTMSRLSMRPVR
jgi:hypothetical protein